MRNLDLIKIYLDFIFLDRKLERGLCGRRKGLVGMGKKRKWKERQMLYVLFYIWNLDFKI